jgi:tRNA(adenine34) deaminase
MNSNYFMNIALIWAKKAFIADEVPVGAVIVENNQVIIATHNRNIELKDPTAHAEILALRLACEYKNSPRLDNCDLYITLEPCPMCAFAISLARVKRIYYAADDKKFGGVENGARVFSSSSCHHRPEIYSGIAQLEAEKLMVEFFKAKR